MTPLPTTPALLRVAERVVWFKPPADSLADPLHFLAHVMTYGTIEDIGVVTDAIGLASFRTVLDQAPPGVFDPRSWSYWNVKFGRYPVPPMPSRQGLRSSGAAAA